MHLNEYVAQARATATYRGRLSELGLSGYVSNGLTGEAGEVADEIKKIVGLGEYDEAKAPRDRLPRARHDKIVKELGDTLWYVAAMCDELGVDLEEVAQLNLAKLLARQQAGTLLGGDRSSER